MDVAQAPGTRRAPTSELCDALHLRVETLLEQLFFTTLYIETSYADGRKASGTGFVYNVHVGGGQYATFMVTNKHVIEGAETARLRFVACEDDTMSAPLLGQAHHIDIQAPGTLFTGHPTGDVDVAVLPISPGVSRLKEHGQFVFFRAVTSAVSMDDASVQTLDAMEEVTFLGYPMVSTTR